MNDGIDRSISKYMKRIKSLALTLAFGLVMAYGVSAQTALTALDGSRINVDGQTGRVVVLAIGASWLPLSSTQADATNMLVKKYAGREVVFYFVTTDSLNARSKNFASNETLEKFAFTNKLAIPVLRDPDGAATLKKFRVEQVPSFVILDRNGVPVGEPFGGIDPKYDITVPLSRAIDQALKAR